LIETNFDLLVEKAILVGVVLPSSKRWEVEENLAELKLLTETAGVEVVDILIQDRNRLHPATFLGSGKVDELSQLLKAKNGTVVIFDDDLSPAQTRNLERATEVKIIDRSSLILDIFAKHARTREAKTQVELAQLQYLLPRLTRQWSHLSRQVGGIGTKGPGETQLETDRRLIRNRIEFLRKELRKIERRHVTQRKGRRNMFKASLVGYTNVGKSSIMNVLSGSDVLVENQLFATLDSTTRNVRLNDNHEILLSDTVGFIKKLPHHLIVSFKTTLDEIRDADLLLHVVDASQPGYQEQVYTVKQVLNDININGIPTLMVFNKIDLLENKELIGALKKQYPGSVFISALRHIRINSLREQIKDIIEKSYVDCEIELPIHNQTLVHFVHSNAIVTEQNYNEAYIHLRFKTTLNMKDKIFQTIQNKINDVVGKNHI
jgi:GTP-binding protein HflX